MSPDEELDTLLKRLRSIPAPSRAPSLASQAAYQADAERLLDGRACIRTQSTAYRYRAALNWYMRQLGDSLAAEVDLTHRILQQPIPDGTLITLRTAVESLERFPCDADSFDHEAQEDAQTAAMASGRSCSKREMLEWLPDDWRECMLDTIDEDDEYARLALAILIATGLRPSELERGVNVARVQDENALEFTIFGSKVTEENGQARRTIEVLIEGDSVMRTIEDVLCLHYSGEWDTTRCSKARLQHIVRKAAAQAFPDLIELPSPISFRHQLAADLKADGVSQTDIAAFLGHRSTSTQGKYGYKRDGKGGRQKIRKVWAINPVRARTRSHIVWSDLLDLCDRLRPQGCAGEGTDGPSQPKQGL